MDKALTWFIRAWIVFALLVNAAAVIGMFLSAETFWAGWKQFTQTYSPFNVANVFMELILLSPALGAIYWRDRRRRTRSGT